MLIASYQNTTTSAGPPVYYCNTVTQNTNDTVEMYWPRICADYASGLIVSHAYLVLVLNFQHGSGAPEVLHYWLCLLQELITVDRSLYIQNKRMLQSLKTYSCYGIFEAMTACKCLNRNFRSTFFLSSRGATRLSCESDWLISGFVSSRRCIARSRSNAVT